MREDLSLKYYAVDVEYNYSTQIGPFESDAELYRAIDEKGWVKALVIEVSSDGEIETYMHR